MNKRRLPAIALLALAIGPVTAWALPPFGASVDFPTGVGPYSVALGDLNADGRADLAVASGIGVSVLLNTGNAVFGAKTDFAAAASPSWVAIGDLNGDGKRDLVVANAGSGSVSVLLGNGDGTFAAKTDFATGASPVFVAIGDLNGDGKLDLAVANYSSASVSVLLGNGNGTFGTKTDFVTAGTPGCVQIGDVNGDLKPDLVTSNFSPGSVSVLLGAGNGSFGAKTDFTTGSFPASVAIGDLNGDGIPDLATANYIPNTASVLLGNGNGTFAAKTDFATGSRPRSVAIGDLDGDGRADLAVANYTSNSMSLLPGDGTGAFGPKIDFAAGSGPYAVAIGDLNGDGNLDVALANSGANTVSVLLRQFQPSTTLLSSSPNPSVLGGAVTLTAVVVPDSSTGLVTFRDGATTLGSATLSGGLATLATSALGAGEHPLTASYAGDRFVAASVSPVSIHIVDQQTTTLSLTASPNPSAIGVSVVLRAVITPAIASGIVEFDDGASLIGTAELRGGVATLTVPNLCGGAYSWTASYAGDAGHLGCTSPVLAHVVDPAPSTVTVSSSPNPSRLGQAVSFTAGVTSAASGICPLTGTVEFLGDGVPLGPPVSLVAGTATLSGVTGLATGAHAIQATYSGNASFLGGASPTLSHDVETPVPAIVGVHDVVNDQGGFVKLLWNASYLDLDPYNTIESYWVLRSLSPAAAAIALKAGTPVPLRDAGAAQAREGALVTLPSAGTAYVWQFIANQPAFHLPNYSYVAATTRDSVAGSNPRTSFMIIARTAGGAETWASEPDSGYSVDNLAPRTPSPFTGTYASGAATLHWGRNAEPDMAEYRLYRGTVANFVPGTGNLLVARPDTGYVDAVGGLYFYQLCAVDVHGNVSGYASLRPSGSAGVAGDGALAFSLEGVRPNPSRGEHLNVSFTLPSSASATLELLDVGGRRLESHEVGALGAGRHTAALGAERRLAPGLYLARLTQGASVRIARVAVLR